MKNYVNYCVIFDREMEKTWNEIKNISEILKSIASANKALKEAVHLGGKMRSIAQKQLNYNSVLVEKNIKNKHELQSKFHKMYQKSFEEYKIRYQKHLEHKKKENNKIMKEKLSPPPVKTLRQRKLERVKMKLDNVELFANAFIPKELFKEIESELKNP